MLNPHTIGLFIYLKPTKITGGYFDPSEFAPPQNCHKSLQLFGTKRNKKS